MIRLKEGEEMKKIYVKPAIEIEDFLLSEYIASCDPSFSNNMDVDDIMGAVQGFTGYFTQAMGCRNIAQSGVDYISPNGTKLCYHTNSAVVFSS